MAIYHFSMRVFSRGAGHNAVSAAAYRSFEKLIDKEAYAQEKTRIDSLRGEKSSDEIAAERQKKIGVYDYRRRGKVSHSEIMTPLNAPSWMKDREALWNGVEQSEKRKDAQLAREINIALPRELDLEQQKQLLRGYVQEQFVSKGMVADVAIHDNQGNNPHAHVMLTLREIRGGGFGQKNRSWNNRENLKGWREAWADHANKALEATGNNGRIDHRTLKEQSIDREAQIHLGKHATQAIRQEKETPRQLRLKKIHQKNAIRNAFNNANNKVAVIETDKATQQSTRQKSRPEHKRHHWRER